MPLPLPVTYREAVASRAPTSAGFALDNGTATLGYYVDPLSVEDALTDLLGTTDYDGPGDGKLARLLPKAHPFYPWLYAERLSNVQGVGKPTLFNITQSYEAPLVVNQIALYQTYLCTVSFVQRPYMVLQDGDIPVFADTWTDENNIARNFWHTREYARFTTLDADYDNDVVTAQHGRMMFRGGTAEGKAFTGMPRVTIPKAVIKLRWFGVPLRYVTSSSAFLWRYQNYINQADFWAWKKGELLYKGFRILRQYTPVVPDTIPNFGLPVFGTEKLCDLEIVLEWTRRERAATPVAPVANGNWLMEGHNLMPNYFDRKFYYVSAESPVAAGQYPLFLSAPVPQILFTDPDVAQPP